MHPASPTHTREEGEQLKGALPGNSSMAQSGQLHEDLGKNRQLTMVPQLPGHSLWTACCPACGMATASSAPSWPRQVACQPDLTAAEGKCKWSSQARGACQNCLRDLGSPRLFLSWLEAQNSSVEQAFLLFGCWALQAACQAMLFRSGHWVLRKPASSTETNAMNSIYPQEAHVSCTPTLMAWGAFLEGK